jgi:hypothetical protein
MSTAALSASRRARVSSVSASVSVVDVAAPLMKSSCATRYASCAAASSRFDVSIANSASLTEL